MLSRIFETAIQKCGLRAGQTVLVGVSGGPDSLCLLDTLTRLGFRTIAAYFNHQLRAESEDELVEVGRVAASLQIRFISGRGDVAATATKMGKSLEEAAREMRYAFLFNSARENHADAVAVGHNADDQVETILMHLLRGSGLAGMRGMAFRSLTQWDDRIPLVRPLLATWRKDILAYCNTAGLQPSLDASNLDRHFFRNRIRLDLIPELEMMAPGVRRRIWNLSQLVADDLDLMDSIEEQSWRLCVMEQGPDYIQYDLTALRGQPESLQRRIIRRGAAALQSTGDTLSMDSTLRAVKFLQTGTRGRKIELEGPLLLRVQGDRLLLTNRTYRAATGAFPHMSIADGALLEVDGEIELGMGWVLHAETCRPPAEDELHQPLQALQMDAWLDADALPGQLSLRRPRAGDRYQPLGMQAGRQKLSDFWINRKIPADVRKDWPLLVCGDEIVWVLGFAPNQTVRVRPETVSCIHLMLRRKN